MAILAAALSSTHTPGLACGFHDDVTLARGIINRVYPDALHVIGALGTAVADGRLPPPDVRKGADLFGIRYRATMAAVEGFRDALSAAPATPSPFSLILLEPMLWTRFASDQAHLRAEVHVTGPAPGDLVLVSEEIIIRAVADGALSISDAHRLGLIRIYGPDEQRARFLTSYGVTAGIKRTTGGSL
jgi:hypothetical protein